MQFGQRSFQSGIVEATPASQFIAAHFLMYTCGDALESSSLPLREPTLGEEARKLHTTRSPDRLQRRERADEPPIDSLVDVLARHRAAHDVDELAVRVLLVPVRVIAVLLLQEPGDRPDISELAAPPGHAASA